MNIKYNTLNQATIPGTWKVWLQNTNTIECVAIFKDRLHALDFADQLENVIVTRHNTVAMEIEMDE